MNQRLTSFSPATTFIAICTVTPVAIDLPAVLQYERVVELSLPVSGVVSKVLVEEGQSVSRR